MVKCISIRHSAISYYFANIVKDRGIDAGITNQEGIVCCGKRHNNGTDKNTKINYSRLCFYIFRKLFHSGISDSM